MTRMLSVILLLLLSGCGSDAPTTVPSPIPDAPQVSSGSIIFPAQNAQVAGNVQLDIEVADADGIAQIRIVADTGTFAHIVCDSLAACGQQFFSESVGGIDPALLGASPGLLTLSVWVTDGAGNDLEVASIQINWQPRYITGVQLSRSSDGTELTVSWDSDATLLRYNIYIASQSGVNAQTYPQLANGAAYLAITEASFIVKPLLPQAVYYVLVTGVDGSGETAYSTEQVALAAGSGNQPPVAVDDSESIDEDTNGDFFPLTNDYDPDGDNLRVLDATSSSSSVYVYIVNEEEINVVPAANFNGVVSIEYIVADAYGATDTGTLTVTVNPVNDPPDVQNESVSTLVNTPVNIDVLANDSDVDGDPLSVSPQPSTNGSVVLESDNTITFTPLNGYIGTDDIVYDVEDGQGGVTQGRATVTVSAASAPPVASDDSYTLIENTTFTADKSGGLLINDTDPNNDALTVNTTPVSEVTSGTLTLFADGAFRYAPNSNFTGTDAFTYEVQDSGGLTDTGTVTLTVNELPANLTGNSITMQGEFYYIGLGETSAGSGVGTGRYRIGDCLQIVDTQCTMTGTYYEASDSGNQPSQQGNYVFTMTYGGTGDSPVIAQSNAAGSDSVFFTDVGDALFTLYLFPDVGGKIKAFFPDDIYGSLANFSAFIQPLQTCTGLPTGVTCKIGNVGLYAGATDTAPLDRLAISLAGYATVDTTSEPIANEDSYSVSADTTTSVSPGVLDNDEDYDTPIIGDVLSVRSQAATTLTQPVALGVDELRQRYYVYTGFGNDITVMDRAGTALTSIPWPGEGANDADIDLAPVTMSLANTTVTQGSVLVFNGETGATEVYALDAAAGTVTATLNTAFGASHVVGGAYNPVTKTLFLLQDNVPGGGAGNTVAEVDPDSGAVLSSFAINNSSTVFDVSFGDLDINNETGTLYLVSSVEGMIAEFTRDGSFIRYITLPSEISSPSGLAVSDERDRLWMVNNTNASPVYELQFSNDGRLTSLVAKLISGPAHGSVNFRLDGTFSYTPDSGFTGNDSFVYEAQDQTGKYARATVTITVN